MEFLEQRQRWKKINALTPQKLELAHRVLNEIRTGADVMSVLRRNPLPDGGYLNKAALVAAYNEMVSSG
ncbi:MAG TPA: hypothetical protein DEP19_09470, partial [Anaerolineae bacterium]|nr:hypothetical protein [Anaerolineae bacterium]